MKDYRLLRYFDFKKIVPLAFFVSFYSACSQQLIANFQILLYFHAFVPLSIMSSSGILVVLPASLHCYSFILCTFLIYKGPIFMLKKGRFPREEWRGQKHFPGRRPQALVPLSLAQSPWPPELFRLEPPLSMLLII